MKNDSNGFSAAYTKNQKQTSRTFEEGIFFNMKQLYDLPNELVFPIIDAADEYEEDGNRILEVSLDMEPLTLVNCILPAFPSRHLVRSISDWKKFL